MGQKGEVRKRRPATGWAGRGGCKCTKNSVSSGQDTKVATGRGQGSRVTPPQRGQAPPSGSSVFENKNRTRKCLFGCWCSPHPHSNAKVCPSSSKQIQSNSNQHPFVKKDKQEKKRKAQLLPALPVCTVRSSGPEHGGQFYSPDCSHPVGGASPPWPEPLPSQQESCQETLGTEGRKVPVAGHEVWRRGSRPGTVCTLGHSDGLCWVTAGWGLWVLWPSVLCWPAEPERSGHLHLLTQREPQGPCGNVDFCSFSPNSFGKKPPIVTCPVYYYYF